MQYILTEEEYRKLVPVERFNQKLDMIERTNNKILELTGYECRSEKDTPLSFFCDNCPVGVFGTNSCHILGQRYSK